MGIRDTAGHTNRRCSAPGRPYLAASPTGVHATGANGVDGELTIAVDASSPGGEVDVAWPLLGTGPPQVSASCAAGTQWDSVGARLDLTVRSGDACTMQVAALAIPA